MLACKRSRWLNKIHANWNRRKTAQRPVPYVRLIEQLKYFRKQSSWVHQKSTRALWSFTWNVYSNFAKCKKYSIFSDTIACKINGASKMNSWEEKTESLSCNQSEVCRIDCSPMFFVHVYSFHLMCSLYLSHLQIQVSLNRLPMCVCTCNCVSFIGDNLCVQID